MVKDLSQVRGIRNNNPLNLRKSKAAWLGKIAGGSDKEFEQFESMLMGIRAAMINARTIIRRNKGCTVEQFVNIWAPASDGNDPKKYVETVVRLAMVNKDWVMRFEDADLIPRILWAMAKVECGVAIRSQLFYDAYNMI